MREDDEQQAIIFFGAKTYGSKFGIDLPWNFSYDILHHVFHVRFYIDGILLSQYYEKLQPKSLQHNLYGRHLDLQHQCEISVTKQCQNY